MVKGRTCHYAKDTAEKLCGERRIAVFGARTVAEEVAVCLMGEPYSIDISCFIVSRAEDNPPRFMGKRVFPLDWAERHLPKDTLVVIAAMEKNLESILECLHQSGFYNLLPLTFESDLWSCIRGNYYMEYCRRNQKRYLMLEEELAEGTGGSGADDVCVYAVKCHTDRRLTEDASRYSWEIPIQAGAELAPQAICDVRDNTGENISGKNREYCELTALYWIWKNTSSRYAGLCHYRRHFELDGGQLSRLAESDIDIVLTVPILNFPSVGAVYGRDHVPADWEIMMRGIGELCPDYMGTARDVQEGIYYYAYNMFIARRTVLDEYCGWLFPILSYCEEHCERKEDPYQNRYLGFLAERLLTIFVKHHEERYKIVHAKKHFMAK